MIHPRLNVRSVRVNRGVKMKMNSEQCIADWFRSAEGCEVAPARTQGDSNAIYDVTTQRQNTSQHQSTRQQFDSLYLYQNRFY